LGLTRTALKALVQRNVIFSQVNIELCSRCNLHCRYCALDPQRKQAFLDSAIYEMFLEEIVQGAHKIRTLCLSHSGEVLQHPKFFLFLEKTRWFKAASPDTKIIMDTNLTLLTASTIDTIVDYGIIDEIICSIDGRDKAAYERLRPPASYETVMGNLKYLLSLSKRPRVVINNGNLHPETATTIWSPLMQALLERADQVVDYQFHDWGGQLKEHPIPAKGLCRYVTNQLVLTAEGKIAKCCIDLNGRTARCYVHYDNLGYVLKQQRHDILLMLLHKRSHVKGCDRCEMT